MLKFTLKSYLPIIVLCGILAGCDDSVNPVDSPAPAPPTNLTATTLTSASVRLDWTAPITALDSISSYILSVNGKDKSDTLIVSRITTSYNVAGLLPQSSYTFTLKTKGLNGKLSNGISIQGTTAADTVPAPDPPTNLRALSGDDQTVRLQWTASASANDSNFAHYELTVTPGVGATYVIPKAAASYEVAGLTEGTVYTFSLKAKNTSLSGNLSTAATIQWSPATRIYGVRLYETESVEFGHGIKLSTGEVLKDANGDRWDIGLDTRTINGITSYDIGSPSLLSYDITLKRTTLISSKIYQNVASLDDVFDTEVFTPASIDVARIINFNNAPSGFVFFAKTQEGNYAKILVKANNGVILQGIAPNRYVEMDISYQSAANIPYAFKRNTGLGNPTFKTRENSSFKKSQ